MLERQCRLMNTVATGLAELDYSAAGIYSLRSASWVLSSSRRFCNFAKSWIDCAVRYLVDPVTRPPNPLISLAIHVLVKGCEPRQNHSKSPPHITNHSYFFLWVSAPRIHANAVTTSSRVYVGRNCPSV
jgi:hypothetical protein